MDTVYEKVAQEMEARPAEMGAQALRQPTQTMEKSLPYVPCTETDDCDKRQKQEMRNQRAAVRVVTAVALAKNA